jgi:hypothetical protein
MNKYQLLSSNLLKQLIRAAVIPSACLLYASAHAAFIAESHACTNSAKRGEGG